MNTLEEFTKKYINETTQQLTKKPKKIKQKDMAHIQVHARAEIIMMDVLFLPEDNGFPYALVALDLATNNIDCEPIKTKHAQTILNAFKIILKRKFIKLPRTMVITDDGNEVFAQYLSKNKIIHRETISGKHRQMMPMDSRCAVIGSYLMRAMHTDETVTGETSRKWKARLTQLVKILNTPQYLKQQLWTADVPDNFGNTGGPPQTLLNIGQEVRIPMDNPIDHITNKRLHGTFRQGDLRWSKQKYKVAWVYLNPEQPPLYAVEDLESNLLKNV